MTRRFDPLETIVERSLGFLESHPDFRLGCLDHSGDLDRRLLIPQLCLPKLPFPALADQNRLSPHRWAYRAYQALGLVRSWRLSSRVPLKGDGVILQAGFRLDWAGRNYFRYQRCGYLKYPQKCQKCLFSSVIFANLPQIDLSAALIAHGPAAHQLEQKGRSLIKE